MLLLDMCRGNMKAKMTDITDMKDMTDIIDTDALFGIVNVAQIVDNESTLEKRVKFGCSSYVGIAAMAIENVIRKLNR